jgi:hypothetical protein
MRPSAFQGESYIAVGCTRGVYISKYATEYCESESLELSLILVTNHPVASISKSPGIP